jgi:site-specific DNA-adenine methylase
VRDGAITAVVPYFGAKRTLGARIASEIGDHRAYFEPFCGASYIHDFTDADHARLAEAVDRFKLARVVVSYYEHDRVRSLYPGWTVVECPTNKAMLSGNARGKLGPVEAPEILLINGPSHTSSGLFTA